MSDVDCWYCGLRPKEGECFPFGHLTPLSRGGMDCPPNRVAVCPACQAAKREQTLEEYRAACGCGAFWGEIECWR